jgi:MinD-like ATPase involved in chromosome partitioning or flagellar assembly
VSKFTVPEDRAAVERSVFEGRPLTVSDPAHPIAKAIYELAHAFCPVFGPQLCGTARKRPGLRGLVEAVRRW